MDNILDFACVFEARRKDDEQNAVPIGEWQAVLFTPNTSWPQGLFVSSLADISHWPMSAIEYRCCTAWFAKNTGALLIQSVEGAPAVVSGIIENGDLTVYAMDVPSGREAVDYVLRWFKEQTEQVIERSKESK